MSAAEQSGAPMSAAPAREPYRRIGAAARRSIDQHLAFVRVGARLSRNQIHDAAERRSAVQRRSDAFDHFNLRQVHRRNLQNADRSGLAIER